jgi:hypothetical protein
MTLHDQLAVAKQRSRARSLAKGRPYRSSSMNQGYTRIDRERGKPVIVCLEPKRDEFMRNTISDELTRI